MPDSTFFLGHSRRSAGIPVLGSPRALGPRGGEGIRPVCSEVPRRIRFVGARGLCHHLPMAKTVIVKLTDDLDGGDADETIHFALDGRSYEVDLSAANASKLRDALKPYIEKGRGSSGGSRARSPEPVAPRPRSRSTHSWKATRRPASGAWANMPTARRISDARIKSWIAAGKP